MEFLFYLLVFLVFTTYLQNILQFIVYIFSFIFLKNFFKKMKLRKNFGFVGIFYERRSHELISPTAQVLMKYGHLPRLNQGGVKISEDAKKELQLLYFATNGRWGFKNLNIVSAKSVGSIGITI